MDWNTFKATVWDVGKFILGSTIATGIIAFFAKSYIDQFLKRRLEKYKIELAKEVSIFNHRLSKMSEIYAHIAKASGAFLSNPQRDVAIDRYAYNYGNKYLTHLSENKTALNTSLIGSIDALNERLKNILSDIELHRTKLPSSGGFTMEDDDKLKEAIIAECVTLYEQGAKLSVEIMRLLEEEIRKEQITL